MRRITADAPRFGRGLRRALGVPLRWRLENNQYAFPWELWLTRTTERLVTRRSLVTGQPLSHSMKAAC
jgi:anaerobic magnesium-protoporphyrin IX monomethyl ester cyclase